MFTFSPGKVNLGGWPRAQESRVITGANRASLTGHVMSSLCGGRCMRKFSTFVAAAAVAVTTVALTAGPALADPPGSTVPKDTSIVSVGADTTEFLFDQIDTAYNGTKPTNFEYSWDA